MNRLPLITPRLLKNNFIRSHYNKEKQLSNIIALLQIRNRKLKEKWKNTQ